ncbi:MAG: hypothetical protein KDK30_08470 [Leptospiraceae bacterium]|nr:hypothetical protein [Leptospiraceae bacterium]
MHWTYLAQITAFDRYWDSVALFGLRFALVALGLYLAMQAISHIPYLSRYLNATWGQLILFLFLFCLAFLLTFWQPPLRFFHSLGVVDADSTLLVWLDIVVSALALSRSGQIWHYLFRWLDRRSA